MISRIQKNASETIYMYLCPVFPFSCNAGAVTTTKKIQHNSSGNTFSLTCVKCILHEVLSYFKPKGLQFQALQ